MSSSEAEQVDRLLERCRADHARWINGDPSGYVLPEDGTLMGAFGGAFPGGAGTADRQRATGAIWVSGTGDVELLAGSATGDIAWLVMIERASVLFAGRSEPTRWDLRVTELFRKIDGEWTRIHRHADPLVDQHPLDELLALLGGQ